MNDLIVDVNGWFTSGFRGRAPLRIVDTDLNTPTWMRAPGAVSGFFALESAMDELAVKLGIDPVHFGVIVTLNLAIGQQTPPVASVLLLTCSIAKESVWDVTKANIPFIGVLLARPSGFFGSVHVSRV